MSRADAAGFLLLRDGAVLIEDRPDRGGGWSFPAGKAEPEDVTTRDIMRREMMEELGCTPNVAQHVGDWAFTDGSGKVLAVYLVPSFAGEPPAVGGDGNTLRWCTVEDLATENLHPISRSIYGAVWGCGVAPFDVHCTFRN